MAKSSKRKRTKKSGVSRSRLIAISVFAMALTVAVLWYFSRQWRAEERPSDFGTTLQEYAALHECQVVAADDPIRKVDGIFLRSWVIKAPSEAEAEVLLEDLNSAASILDAEIEVEGTGVSQIPGLTIRFPIEVFDVEILVAEPTPAPTPSPRPTPTATPRPPLPADARGRLAIILDDGGQSMDLVPLATSLPPEVAVSVLPFLPYSAECASTMYKSGHEIWLHLPLEPTGYPDQNPGPGAILVAMSEDEIRTKTRMALNNVPHIVGVNHHMGSRASANLRVMTWIMQEISARGLAFVDSRTTVETVAEAAARAQGVPTGRRRVFLDNTRSRAAIRRSLRDAVYRARREGEILAIGHLVPVTVETLLEELAKLDRRQIELVKPTQLVD